MIIGKETKVLKAIDPNKPKVLMQQDSRQLYMWTEALASRADMREVEYNVETEEVVVPKEERVVIKSRKKAPVVISGSAGDGPIPPSTRTLESAQPAEAVLVEDVGDEDVGDEDSVDTMLEDLLND